MAYEDLRLSEPSPEFTKAADAIRAETGGTVQDSYVDTRGFGRVKAPSYVLRYGLGLPETEETAVITPRVEEIDADDDSTKI